MTDFGQLLKQVEDGIEGKSKWIPIGYDKLGSHIGIGQKIYTLIGGNSGTGKTGFTDCTYVLNPYKWYKENKDNTDIKFKIIYRSMERSKSFKLGKWVCSKLYEDYRIMLDVPTIFGWGSKKNHIPQEVYEKIKGCRDYFEEMLDVVEIIDGSENPTGVRNHLIKYALENGKLIEKSEFVKEYKPTNPNLITTVVIDHIGKLKNERGYSKKERIDKMSEYLGEVRDRYGLSPIVVSQFNRNLSDSQRAKNKELTPDPDDFKDTGNLYEDCDVALALFNPYKLKEYEHMGYDIKKFVNNKGYNRFRSITALKNTYGIDDFRVGFAFIGENGLFGELPKANEMELKDYDRIRTI